MSFFRVTLLCVLIATSVLCNGISNDFVVGNGAGLFYKFNTNSRAVNCMDSVGRVVRTFNMPFYPTSASLTASVDYAVVTGIHTSTATTTTTSTFISTVNLSTGAIIRTTTTEASTKIAAVKDDYVIVQANKCYRRLCLNTFAESQNTICTATPTRFLGLLDNSVAALTCTQTSAVSTININSFLDNTISNAAQVIQGACNGVPVLAQGGHIYTTNTSGLMFKYQVASKALIMSSSINLGISGQISLVRDICNNDQLTVIGVNNGNCGLSQINLKSFTTINAPLSIRLNLLGVLGVGLNLRTSRIGLFGAVSGNSILLGGVGSNVCAVGSNGLFCNGAAASANLNLPSGLNRCSVVNLGMNLGVSF
ncbi:receptor-type tyrosine-protein phosphatase C [Acrasis kona]|uniref:Receptor-type tyrosine-protein phosphatase C n=1 Tax=Acrasis kona TaxID=1008807 RepID=A0AAW2ZJZ2_9EUKA